NRRTVIGPSSAFDFKDLGSSTSEASGRVNSSGGGSGSESAQAHHQNQSDGLPRAI
ncbi:7368_t:CDS:1, partial [Paraglomus occultum]